jgi:methylated-DNA-[protein]-cysteine S-methyltransferase
MDRVDDALKDFFAPPADPGLARRLVRGVHEESGSLEALVGRFRLVATDRGLRRLEYRRGADEVTGGGRAHAARARAELREYLAGTRTFFTVPVDLTGVPEFQAKVLAEAARIPFGAVTSYATLAERIGHPRAARAVGNALGANPVPIVVPCHRVVRGDGTWGPYAFGGTMKTRLLRLERATPALIGCTSTRIVCRRGCAHEQRVGEGNRVVFASVGDAASVGYRPCRVCRPERAA